MKSKQNLLENVVHGIFLLLGLVTVGCVLLITDGSQPSLIAAIRMQADGFLSKRLPVAAMRRQFEQIAEVAGGRITPLWLEVNKEAGTAKVLRAFQREELDYDIAEHLIIELYSK